MGDLSILTDLSLITLSRHKRHLVIHTNTTIHICVHVFMFDLFPIHSDIAIVCWFGGRSTFNVVNFLHAISHLIMIAQDFWKFEKVGSLIMVDTSDSHPAIAKANWLEVFSSKMILPTFSSDLYIWNLSTSNARDDLLNPFQTALLSSCRLKQLTVILRVWRVHLNRL